MLLKKTFLIKETPTRHPGPEAYVNGLNAAREEASRMCKSLASEVIQACQLENGCRGTLESALMDAWHQGKYGMRPKRKEQPDFDGLPF
jgi:hypothetical protein